jgi:hypothetical protein
MGFARPARWASLGRLDGLRSAGSMGFARLRLAARPLRGLAALALAACATPPAGAPPPSAFEREARLAAPVPDVADQTAAELARAALLSRPDEAARAVERLEAIETVLEAAGEAPTGLVPAAADLANAAQGDERAYRAATRELLERDDLDPALRARLEIAERDDPLALARERLRENWLLEFGRAFNAVAEPLGSSITTFTLAPYRLARSLVNYALELHAREPLPLRERQALAHWKGFLARHPDAPEAEELAPRVADAEWRRQQTQRVRDLRVAEDALGEEQHAFALVHADRALRRMPEDREASRLRDAATEGLLEVREKRRRSLASAPELDPAALPAAQRELAVALLRPGGDAVAAARRVEATSAPLADEARFARAVALGEIGQEDAMWRELGELAERDPERSSMARHAAALVASPETNPWRAFTRARIAHGLARSRWVVLGPFAAGPRERNLPRPLEWLVDLPSMAESVFSLPVRLVELPWAPPLGSERPAARAARAYLARRPGGVHAEAARRWLRDYESGRGNHLAALRLAEELEGEDPEELAELREKAARQWLEAAAHERDPALRNAMYRELARDLPATAAAREAGRRARRELEEATPQGVRISRGFLEENPAVAGPAGFALRPELLDGEPANGELHRVGVTLLGGSVVEVGYLGAEGDPEAPPRAERERLDPEAMARVVSLLEETSFRNSLLDADDALVADADRDVFFERLRLGLADEIDPRPAARSSYAYRGLRERYGMVRSRESILPFDLVLRGSLSDLSLGAFPRFRTPRETPDSFLYR